MKLLFVVVRKKKGTRSKHRNNQQINRQLNDNPCIVSLSVKGNKTRKTNKILVK